MKQVQFTFQDDKKLEEELRKLRQWARSNFCSKVLIQICTEIPDRERIGHVCETIERLMPEALYAGCSSNGNIVNGDFSGGSIAVICTLFEYPSTHVEVLQYPLQADTQENVVQMLEAAMDERPWVKAVELLVTIRGMSMTTLCESLSHIRKSGEGYRFYPLWRRRFSRGDFLCHRLEASRLVYACYCGGWLYPEGTESPSGV